MGAQGCTIANSMMPQGHRGGQPQVKDMGVLTHMVCEGWGSEWVEQEGWLDWLGELVER